MTIGLDMMGGDFAPLEAVKGASEYLQPEISTPRLSLLVMNPNSNLYFQNIKFLRIK
jgi:fatty acid/phospholipid biosynthesis enzyme